MRLSWGKNQTKPKQRAQSVFASENSSPNPTAAPAPAETPVVPEDSSSYLFGCGSHNNCMPTQLYLDLLFPERRYSPNLSASLDFSPTLDNFKNKNQN